MSPIIVPTKEQLMAHAVQPFTEGAAVQDVVEEHKQEIALILTSLMNISVIDQMTVKDISTLVTVGQVAFYCGWRAAKAETPDPTIWSDVNIEAPNND